MSSAPAAPLGWGPIELPAYLAPLWGGEHAVVAPALGLTGGAGLGVLVGPLRARGRGVRSRGVQLTLLAPESVPLAPELVAEAAAAVEAALFADEMVRTLIAHGPGAAVLRTLPVLRLGLWFPILWGAVFLLASGGRPVELAAALWLLLGLPACVAWYRRRRLVALAEAAHAARDALLDHPPVRVLQHAGLAELRGIIAAADGPASAYQAAAAGSGWCGVPVLGLFYTDLATRSRPDPAPQPQPAVPAVAAGDSAAGDDGT